MIYFAGDKNNEIDFVTLAVYSCPSSCDADVSYPKEVVWVQTPQG